MKDTSQKLSTATVALHWLVGVVVIALLAVGWYMAAYEVYFLYPIHKSVGMLIVAAVLARIWWRAVNGFPQFLPSVPKWRRTIARSVHWILLIGTILMPLSGIAMSVGGGRGLDIFGWELLAANINAASGEIIARNESIARLANNAHYYIGRIMMAAIALHIAGALWHHFVNKDNTLRRMLGKSA